MRFLHHWLQKCLQIKRRLQMPPPQHSLQQKRQRLPQLKQVRQLLLQPLLPLILQHQVGHQVQRPVQILVGEKTKYE